MGKIINSIQCMYVLWFNFVLGLTFYFPLSLGMIMYYNEFETKEN